MSIKLNSTEELLQSEIAERVNSVRKIFPGSRQREDAQRAIGEAGGRAHQLHMLLKAQGREPKHHGYMIKNRGLTPDDPKFYNHLHPLEDLLKFIEDPHANDDPADRTIGEEFKFEVYSPRWGHKDCYHLTRTKDGWDVRHMGIDGPCDKRGHPFLFENLEHDLIDYPASLELRMQSLWNQAEKEGLSKEAVQDAIRELADWVSITAKNAPREDLAKAT